MAGGRFLICNGRALAQLPLIVIREVVALNMHISVIAIGMLVFTSEIIAADPSAIAAARAQAAIQRLAILEQRKEVRVQVREQVVVQTTIAVATVRDAVAESLESAKSKAKEQARKLAEEKKDLVKSARRKEN
jgi:hypothetical protein